MTEREVIHKDLGKNESLKELGRILAERREAAGITLETVFDRTRIRLDYLRGIENGEYKDFPEIVYVKGFVRTYLKLIGAEDLKNDFMTQLDRLSQQLNNNSNIKRDPKQPVKKPSNILGSGSSVPKGFKPASHFWLFLVLASALVGTGVYVWYAVTYGGVDFKNIKLFNFNFANNNNNNVTIPALEVTAEDVSPENESGDVGEVVSVDEAVTEETEEAEEVTPSLEIRAVNDVWLSVAFGNAQPTFRRTLKRGETMRWDLAMPARVVIGRPTAAQVILNGQDLGIANQSAKKSETYIYNPDGTYRKIK